MKKYVVVGFLTEKGQPVEVVPSSWLIDDKTCYWPAKDSNVKSLILKCSEPNGAWSKFPIKIYRRSNSFTTASAKAEKARIVSSIGSDSSEGEEECRASKRAFRKTSKKPRNHRPAVFQSGNDSDFNKMQKVKDSKRPSSKVLQNITDRRVLELPVPPTENHFMNLLLNQEFATPSSPVLSDSPDDREIEISASDINDRPGCSKENYQPGLAKNNFTESSRMLSISNSSCSEETALEKLLKGQAQQNVEFRLLKKEFQRLREKVELKLNAPVSPEVTGVLNNISSSEEFSMLPLKSLEDLYDLEREIENDSSKATSLARFLCRGGGYTSMNAVTLQCMKRLMSRNIAMLFSLEGRQEKKKFSDMNLLNVVIASVKMRYAEAETAVICSRIGRVLAGAPDWDGNRINRKRKSGEEYGKKSGEEDI